MFTTTNFIHVMTENNNNDECGYIFKILWLWSSINHDYK